MELVPRRHTVRRQLQHRPTSSAPPRAVAHSRNVEMVVSGPFFAWVEARRAHHEQRRYSSALKATLAEIGWSSDTGERRLSRWLQDRPERLPRDVVEDALHHATGTPWAFYSVYLGHVHELEHPIAEALVRGLRRAGAHRPRWAVSMVLRAHGRRRPRGAGGLGGIGEIATPL
jgi:hypothetical protein